MPIKANLNRNILSRVFKILTACQDNPIADATRQILTIREWTALKFRMISDVTAVVSIHINVILEIWVTEKILVNDGSP
ncbi:MAG: hypothetical protein JSW07_19155, partial [bacterium]